MANENLVLNSQPINPWLRYHGLNGEYPNDCEAMEVIEMLDGKVSQELYDMMRVMLLGFDERMQLDMAVKLVSFACGQEKRATGCSSADYILESCYQWIAEEYHWVV